MRIPLFQMALCLAVLITGCQTPVFRDGLFAKKEPPPSKDLNAEAGTAESKPAFRNPPAQTQAQNGNQPALAKPPTAAESRLATEIAKGNLALDQKRYSEARLHFETVVKADPNNRHAHHMLGRVGDQQSKFEDAEGHYLKALGENPNDPSLLCDMGYSYFLQGRHDDAKDYLQRTLAIEPSHKMALLNMGALYVDLRDNQQALAYFKQVAPGIQADRLLAAEMNRKVTRKQQENKAWETRVSNDVPKNYQDLQEKMTLARERASADREELKRLIDEKRRLEARIAQSTWEVANAGGELPLTAPGQGLPQDQRLNNQQPWDGRPIQLTQGRESQFEMNPPNPNQQANFQSGPGPNGSAPWMPQQPWGQQPPQQPSMSQDPYGAPYGSNANGMSGPPQNANPQFGYGSGPNGMNPNFANPLMNGGNGTGWDPNLQSGQNGMAPNGPQAGGQLLGGWPNNRMPPTAVVPLNELPAPQSSGQWTPGLPNQLNQLPQSQNPQSGFGQPAQSPQYGADPARRAMSLGMSAGSVFQLPQASTNYEANRLNSPPAGSYSPSLPQAPEGGVYQPQGQTGPAPSQLDPRMWRTLPNVPPASYAPQGQPGFTGQASQR